MKTSLVGLIFCILSSVKVLETARILVILPFPAWSHSMQYERLFETLAGRGHHITMYSLFPPKNRIENFKHVPVDLIHSRGMINNFNFFKYKDVVPNGPTLLTDYLTMTSDNFNFALRITQEVFNNTAMQDLIKSTEKFDLVISELWFVQEALVVFSHKFKAPTVVVGAYGTAHNAFQFMGNPNLYSYMPDVRFGFPTKMNFLQRFQNTILGLYTHVVGDWWYYPVQDRLMRQFSDDPSSLPYIKTLLKNVSLTLINSDVMLEFPGPRVSNMIHIGGIHMEKRELPQDLQKLMDNSSEGVIYVSFGSMIKSSAMSYRMRDIFFRALSRTGLTVLWQWQGSAVENLPRNIHLRNWVPQQDILAHPNCRLFITHGGSNGVLEAINHAIPMVGIAFFADQANNIQHVVELGAGVELKYSNITEDSISWATSSVLNNPSYKHAAVKASQRFNDRQNSPLDTAVWWVEYVLRHRGAPHLRTAFDDLSWVEFLLLDVLVVLVLIVLAIVYLMYLIAVAVRFCVLYPCRRRTKRQVEAKKFYKK